MKAIQIGNILRITNAPLEQYSGSYFLDNEQALSLSKLLAVPHTDDDVLDWMNDHSLERIL